MYTFLGAVLFLLIGVPIFVLTAFIQSLFFPTFGEPDGFRMFIELLIPLLLTASCVFYVLRLLFPRKDTDSLATPIEPQSNIVPFQGAPVVSPELNPEPTASDIPAQKNVEGLGRKVVYDWEGGRDLNALTEEQPKRNPYVTFAIFIVSLIVIRTVLHMFISDMSGGRIYEGDRPSILVIWVIAVIGASVITFKFPKMMR